jgi:hypothetical protein
MVKASHGWTCDICASLIDRPQDGHLEWSPTSAPTKFVLRHHQCGITQNSGHLNLKSVLDGGPAYLVSLFIHDPSGVHGRPPHPTADIAAWADIFRRLFSPGYEQVRSMLTSREATRILADRHVEAYAGYWNKVRAEIKTE